MDAQSRAWTLQPSPPSPVRPTVVVNENYRPLFKAALCGDWKRVEDIFKNDSEAMTAKIMTVEDESVTLLDVAIFAAEDQLVEKLVKLLPPKNDNLNFGRSLCNAARGGRIRMVKALLEKIKPEPKSVALALSTAISWAPMQKDVIWYLAKRTFTPDDVTMSNLIMAGHMDIAFHLTLPHRGLKTTKVTELNRPLVYLVPMMSYFRSRARLGFWENSIYKLGIPQSMVYISFGSYKAMKMAQVPFIKRIVESKLRHDWLMAYGNLAFIEEMRSVQTPKLPEFLLTSGIVLDAASRGISEFIELCLEYFPELMWQKNFAEELITEVVKGRHVELFRLINAHNTNPCLDDDNRTRRGLIEALVEWSPVVEDRSEPSLESLKFKVKVEGGGDLSSKILKWEETSDRRGKTYTEVFVEQCQDLLKEAGQWMKETSSSCSFVATLITTVAFTAAFPVPGGNHDNTGMPIFLHRSSFIVFAVADALALFSSVTATLMFLAILTSCYAIEDFLHSLPSKMILGLTFLFLSLAFMLVAFGSALTIILSERLQWIYIPITLLAAFPVILFAILELTLYVEMVESTYWPPLY